MYHSLHVISVLRSIRQPHDVRVAAGWSFIVIHIIDSFDSSDNPSHGASLRGGWVQVERGASNVIASDDQEDS